MENKIETETHSIDSYCFTHWKMQQLSFYLVCIFCSHALAALMRHAIPHNVLILCLYSCTTCMYVTDHKRQATEQNRGWREENTA